MVVSYDEMKNNNKLSDYSVAEKSSLDIIESIVLDSDGVSTGDIKGILKDRYGLEIQKSLVEKKILDVNRVYGFHAIVRIDGLWYWTGKST